MRVPNSDNPYIAGFIEFDPPTLVSLSRHAVQFHIDAGCRFIPIYTTAPGIALEVNDA